MKAGSLSVVWLRRSLVARFAVTFLSCAAVLSAQQTAQVQFVKITGNNSPGYSPPVRFGPADTLGVRIAGLPAQADVGLRVYGLLNRSPDRAYEKNENVLLVTLRPFELRKRNLAKGNGDLLVPLPDVQMQNLLELTATLIGSGDVLVGPPSSLTLNAAASLQAAPSWLQRVMNSALVDRVLSLYQIVREDPEPRAVFTVPLREGAALSDPIMLLLEFAEYRFLALSPSGDHLAWVIQRPEGYELWTSSVRGIAPVRVFKSPGQILSPSFADENVLLFIASGALMLARTESSQPPRLVPTPFRKLLRIDQVQRSGKSIDCIVSARHPDAPDLDLPYLAKVPVPEGETTVFRLAVNPLYQSYSLLVENVPLFYAGAEEGIEGIYYVQPSAASGTVTKLCKVRSPGLVVLAANGTRLAFAGNP